MPSCGRVALSDGRLVVSNAFPESTLRVWDLVSMKVDFAVKAGFEGFNAAVELEGDRLGTVSNNEGDVAIWDLATGKNVKRWRGHVTRMTNFDPQMHEDYEEFTNGNLTSVAALPGQRLITGGKRNHNFDNPAGWVCCWDTTAGKEGGSLWRWTGQPGKDVMALKADLRRSRLLVGLNDGVIHVFDASLDSAANDQLPKHLFFLDDNQGTVWDIVVLPKESIAAAYGSCTCEGRCDCEKSGRVIVWDLSSPDHAHKTILEHNASVEAVAVCPGAGDHTAPVLACSLNGGRMTFCRAFAADPAVVSSVELNERRVRNNIAANSNCLMLMALSRDPIRKSLLRCDNLGLRALCRLRIVSKDLRKWGTEGLATIPPIRFLGGRYDEDFVTNHTNGQFLVNMVQRLDCAEMKWKVDTPLPKSLSFAASCTLGDGRLIVCGGITENSDYKDEHNRTARSVILGADGWTADELPVLSERVASASACVLKDGRLLVVGGCVDGPDGDGEMSCLEEDEGYGGDTVPYEYDEANPRSVNFGDNGWTTGKTSAFDFKTGEWSALAEMSGKRSDFALGVLDDGRVIVAGGTVITMDWHENAAGRPQTRAATTYQGWYESQEYSLTDTVEIYDPDSDEWTAAAPLAEGSRSCAGCVVDGCFVVSGGVTDLSVCYGTCKAAKENANVGSRTRSKGTVESQKRKEEINFQFHCDCGIAELSGYPLGSKTMQKYDPVADRWEEMPDMLVPRYSHGMCALGSDILVIGNDKECRFHNREIKLLPLASQQHIGPDLFDTTSSTWHVLPVPRAAEMKRPERWSGSRDIVGCQMFRNMDQRMREKLLESPQANLRGFIGVTYPLGMSVVCGGP